jgi:hypothetical protein
MKTRPFLLQAAAKDRFKYKTSSFASLEAAIKRADEMFASGEYSQIRVYERTPIGHRLRQTVR